MKFSYETLEVKEIDDKFLAVYNWSNLNENTCTRVWENVELFDNRGKKIWTVNGMESSRFWNRRIDTFVGTRVYSGRLQLTTFGGSSYDLDFNTGKVIYFEFHK